MNFQDYYLKESLSRMNLKTAQKVKDYLRKAQNR